jgi:lariat debranching enzyme
VAVEGCLHGELEAVYEHLASIQQKMGIKLDLLLICGDFQSLRHQQDMEDMHCPEKYKVMGHFRDYYERKKLAPILTILIGGNHEAVNSLRESHFGGWLAPNIYFLGQAGSIFVRKGGASLRISGCSGIYNASDFKYCTRLERYPLRGKDRITAYHTKQVDLFRLELLARINLMQIEQPEQYGEGYSSFDIFMSHDWPKGKADSHSDMALYGSMKELLTYKPFLQKEIESRSFGSAPLLRVLEVAKPNYWFSAHMHVKYAALYPHQSDRYTHFLSLDKCLGKKSCLQLV